MAEDQPVWVLGPVLEIIHDRLITDHGGLPGLRDSALLESAAARPRQLYAYESPDLFALAAAYAYGIARNHPFVDGNKRVAFLAAYVFLVRNGLRPTMDEAETVLIMNRTAAGDIDEAELADWLRQNCTAAN